MYSKWNVNETLPFNDSDAYWRSEGLFSCSVYVPMAFCLQDDDDDLAGFSNLADAANKVFLSTEQNNISIDYQSWSFRQALSLSGPA